MEDFLSDVSKGTRHVQLWQIRQLTDNEVAKIINATYEYSATFTQLGFFRCGLTSHQLAMLCDGISPHMDHLLLQYANVGDQGIKHIVRLLRRPNSKLERLFVCDDTISDDGVAILAQVMKGNKTLRLLCVTDNPITKRGISAMNEMLKYNITLRTLHFSVQSIPDLDLTEVMKIHTVSRNPEMRADWQRIETICKLGSERWAKNSPLYGLPSDLCRVIRDMLCEKRPTIN